MRRFILGALLLYAAPLLAQDQGQQSAGIVFYSPSSSSGAGSGLTIGTTTITSGTDTRVPFDDAGTLNEDAGLTYTKGTTTLAATHLLGATNACAFAADAAAGSVCLVQNGIHSEGATADTKHLYYVFGDHTGAITKTVLASSNGTGGVITAGSGDNYFGTASLLPNSYWYGDGSGLFSGTVTAGQAAMVGAFADQASNALSSLVQYGSTVGGTSFGVTRSSYGGLFADGSSLGGLLIGTLVSKPVIIGTNNLPALSFDTSQNSQLTPGVWTAKTATLTKTAIVRDGWTRMDFTNAMVVALGASLTGNIEMGQLPANSQIENARLQVTTTCGGTTTLTVSCGITGAGYTDIFTAENFQAAAGTRYVTTMAYPGEDVGSSATSAFCRFTSTISNLSAVTTCTGTLWVKSAVLP